MQPGALMDSLVPVKVDDRLLECDGSSHRLLECDGSSHRRKRSVAWDHFEKLPSENKDGGKARCKHCDLVLTATPRSGTSHLRRHVEKCSKRIVLDISPISMEAASGDFEINIDCGTHRRKMSKVWDEFDKFRGENEEDQKAKCKRCNTVLSAAAKNGTSHLKRHMEKCTRRINLTGETGQSLPLLFSDKQPTDERNYLNSDISFIELRRYISHFIVEGGFPFDIVEKKSFRQMMSKACPQYTPFNRSAVRKELFSLYSKERDNVKEMLGKVHGRICLSTEKWKARETDDEYISVAVHFIDDCWKLHRRVLCLKPLMPAFDRSSAGDEVAYLLSQWHIGHKIFSITMDNALYNKSFVSSIERGLVSDKVLPGGSIFQVHCFSHVLNDIAESSLKLIGDDLDKVRDLVKYVNKSPIQRRKFFDLAEKKFQLLGRRTIRLDIPSRWNTTYKLIDRVLYYKDVFMHLVEWEHNLRSHESWQSLIIVHKFLTVLYDMTSMVVTSKYPTSNTYLKRLLLVHRRMVEISKGPHNLLTDTAAGMLAAFDNYWSENSFILACAAIFDPRYKLKFVEYSFMKLSAGENSAERVNRVMNTLYCLLAEYKRHSATATSQPVGLSGLSSSFARADDDGDVFGDYDQFLSMSSKSQGCKSELDLYLEEPSYDVNSDLDVLEFWSKSSIRYPELAVMARDVLSVPVSSSTMKSAFHIGGKTLSIQGPIMPESVQALVCLQDWVHAQYDSGEEGGDSGDDVGFDDDNVDSVFSEPF